MARKKNKDDQKESRLARTRERIWGARRRLARSLLGPLLNHVHIVECEGKEGDPELACVDSARGAVWLNPHKRQELGEAEWTFVLAHQLLHLGLSHGTRREGREPRLEPGLRTRRRQHASCLQDRPGTRRFRRGSVVSGDARGGDL